MHPRPVTPPPDLQPPPYQLLPEDRAADAGGVVGGAPVPPDANQPQAQGVGDAIGRVGEHVVAQAVAPRRRVGDAIEKFGFFFRAKQHLFGGWSHRLTTPDRPARNSAAGALNWTLHHLSDRKAFGSSVHTGSLLHSLSLMNPDQAIGLGFSGVTLWRLLKNLESTEMQHLLQDLQVATNMTGDPLYGTMLANLQKIHKAVLTQCGVDQEPPVVKADQLLGVRSPALRSFIKSRAVSPNKDVADVVHLLSHDKPDFSLIPQHLLRLRQEPVLQFKLDQYDKKELQLIYHNLEKFSEENFVSGQVSILENPSLQNLYYEVQSTLCVKYGFKATHSVALTPVHEPLTFVADGTARHVLECIDHLSVSYEELNPKAIFYHLTQCTSAELGNLLDLSKMSNARLDQIYSNLRSERMQNLVFTLETYANEQEEKFRVAQNIVYSQSAARLRQFSVALRDLEERVVTEIQDVRQHPIQLQPKITISADTEVIAFINKETLWPTLTVADSADRSLLKSLSTGSVCSDCELLKQLSVFSWQHKSEQKMQVQSLRRFEVEQLGENLRSPRLLNFYKALVFNSRRRDLPNGMARKLTEMHEALRHLATLVREYPGLREGNCEFPDPKSRSRDLVYLEPPAPDLQAELQSFATNYQVIGKPNPTDMMLVALSQRTLSGAHITPNTTETVLYCLSQLSADNVISLENVDRELLVRLRENLQSDAGKHLYGVVRWYSYDESLTEAVRLRFGAMANHLASLMPPNAFVGVESVSPSNAERIAFQNLIGILQVTDNTNLVGLLLLLSKSTLPNAQLVLSHLLEKREGPRDILNRNLELTMFGGNLDGVVQTRLVEIFNNKMLFEQRRLAALPEEQKQRLWKNIAMLQTALSDTSKQSQIADELKQMGSTMSLARPVLHEKLGVLASRLLSPQQLRDGANAEILPSATIPNVDTTDGIVQKTPSNWMKRVIHDLMVSTAEIDVENLLLDMVQLPSANVPGRQFDLENLTDAQLERLRANLNSDRIRALRSALMADSAHNAISAQMSLDLEDFDTRSETVLIARGRRPEPSLPLPPANNDILNGFRERAYEFEKTYTRDVEGIARDAIAAFDVALTQQAIELLTPAADDRVCQYFFEKELPRGRFQIQEKDGSITLLHDSLLNEAELTDAKKRTIISQMFEFIVDRGHQDPELGKVELFEASKNMGQASICAAKSMRQGLSNRDPYLLGPNQAPVEFRGGDVESATYTLRRSAEGILEVVAHGVEANRSFQDAAMPPNQFRTAVSVSRAEITAVIQQPIAFGEADAVSVSSICQTVTYKNNGYVIDPLQAIGVVQE